MQQEELNRFDRTLAILVLLQSKKIVKAQFLSERFGVSLRTIYRDIKSLEAAGVPISGEAGIGYSIMEGYRLPPVMFTKEEAGSFVAAEKLMQKFTDAGLGRYFESAMNKIKSVLKGQEKDWVTVLEKQVWASPRNEMFPKNVPNALELLFNSIAEQKQVYIEYRSFASEQSNSRHIEPVGVFYENDFWYLLAYCHLREEYRQFRTDRIMQIKPTYEPFTRKHEDLKDLRNDFKDCPATRVVIAVNKSAIRYIKDGRKYYGFVAQREKEDCVEMEFLTSSIEGLARWYLMFGDSARVLEPEHFKERINELAEKIRSNNLYS